MKATRQEKARMSTEQEGQDMPIDICCVGGSVDEMTCNHAVNIILVSRSKSYKVCIISRVSLKQFQGAQGKAREGLKRPYKA